MDNGGRWLEEIIHDLVLYPALLQVSDSDIEDGETVVRLVRTKLLVDVLAVV